MAGRKFCTCSSSFVSFGSISQKRKSLKKYKLIDNNKIINLYKNKRRNKYNYIIKNQNNY